MSTLSRSDYSPNKISSVYEKDGLYRVDLLSFTGPDWIRETLSACALLEQAPIISLEKGPNDFDYYFYVESKNCDIMELIKSLVEASND